PAHLGLAVIYEKNGRYDAAIGSLRSALGVDPMQPEALLRLAVNLQRTGATEEAARMLRPLTGIPAWIGAIAVQELARLHAEAKNFEAAEAVLRAGLERFPREGAIYLQLATVLDRQGRAVAGREVMGQFLALPAAERGTSRLRYNRDPEDLWEAVRRQIADSTRNGLPLLAQALGQPAAPATAGNTGS
ncbi:MAG TPA: tetratricopeptide repeat protein, partial [Thermoanaerobaculia bacterium]|nr:tetratricopeptide repeat protein [Thermoanaerobaculia bacterium]